HASHVLCYSMAWMCRNKQEDASSSMGRQLRTALIHCHQILTHHSDRFRTEEEEGAVPLSWLMLLQQCTYIVLYESVILTGQYKVVLLEDLQKFEDKSDVDTLPETPQWLEVIPFRFFGLEKSLAETFRICNYGKSFTNSYERRLSWDIYQKDLSDITEEAHYCPRPTFLTESE